MKEGEKKQIVETDDIYCVICKKPLNQCECQEATHVKTTTDLDHD